MVEKITVVRHGEAKYGQAHIEKIASAKDLTENGISTIISNAKKLAKEIRKDQEVVIWSSPYGRTLETSRLIVEALEEEGVKFRERKIKGGDKWEKAIGVFKKFEEVRNINLKYFNFCLSGGTINFNGRDISLDKSVTNPKDLTFPEYYNNRAWKGIPNTYETKEFIAEMDKIESEEQSNARLTRVVRLVKRYLSTDNKLRIIIVTHQGLMSGINPGTPVNPGDVITITI